MSNVRISLIWEVTLTPNNSLPEVVRFTETPTAHNLRTVLAYKRNNAQDSHRAALLLEIAQFVPQDFVDKLAIKVADTAIAAIRTRIRSAYTVKV